MTLFLDYQVQLPSEDVPVCSAWCEVESVLAVALKSNEVRFYGDEVREIDNLEDDLTYC